MGVRVYAVQCQQNEAADHFYKYLAENTDGKWIKLGQFQDVVDMLMAICYREQGPDMFLVGFFLFIGVNISKRLFSWFSEYKVWSADPDIFFDRNSTN